jgi:hypothetical protein
MGEAMGVQVGARSIDLYLLLLVPFIIPPRANFPLSETSRRSVAASFDAPGPTIIGPRPLPWGLGCFDRFSLKE